MNSLTGGTNELDTITECPEEEGMEDDSQNYSALETPLLVNKGKLIQSIESKA